MGKKAKEGSVNLYYLKNQNVKKDNSVSNSKSKKPTTKKRTVNKKVSDDNKFNFDDEIVIGVTKIKNTKDKKDNKTKKVRKKTTNNSKQKKVQAKKKNMNNKNKTKNTFKIVKYCFITCSILASIICFMLSPVFNLVEIEVNGNSKISKESIISLSEIKTGENIYKINKSNIINKIKQNAYIEEISLKRKLPATLEINIKERQATYILEYVNSYAYINNQGYILEITDAKIDKPIIIGGETASENIKEGNRLVESDLIKLEKVLKIIETATSNEIESFITKIDISDGTNYILHMENEGKTVKLGDITDIHTKMLHIKAILEKEAGVEGEIIVDSVSENSKSRFIQKIN